MPCCAGFIKIITGIIAICGFLNFATVCAQQNEGTIEEYVIKNYREELYIRTDRDMYITGERVWLKVNIMNLLNYSPSDISKVIYIELLDQNMFPLKQLMIRAEKSAGSSSFVLPEDISSGNYLIRAYTQWMKNQPAELFCYRTISVINPFESLDHLSLTEGKLYPDTSSGSGQFRLPQGLSQVVIKDAQGEHVSDQYVFAESDKEIRFTLTLPERPFSTREKVKAEILATDMAGNPVEADISVSVTKSVLADSRSTNGFNRFAGSSFSLYRSGLAWGDKADSGTDSVSFLPETEGHLISGSISSRTTGQPLVNTEISLAYVGKYARCLFSRTDEKGEFNFIVNEDGPNEIVIQPLLPEPGGYYVDIDQPFSTEFSSLKLPGLYLDSSWVSDINNVIIGMQINNIYEPYRQINGEVSKISPRDFYGKPENSVRMSDYIELTTVQEVVKEIIPNVYTLKQNGKYDFILVNKFRGEPFENKPLILLDGIPVYDVEKVLNIDSKEIERADITNTRYFFSNNVFDGIVSFITKKGNLSAMEFDNSIFRQVYEGYQDTYNFHSPDYTTDIMRESRIPDFRNTLYWDAAIHTGSDGKAVFEFFTSDEKLEYTILVEGISADGKPGSTSTSLMVE